MSKDEAVRRPSRNPAYLFIECSSGTTSAACVGPSGDFVGDMPGCDAKFPLCRHLRISAAE
jgi:hypothetical protein